MDTVEKLGKQIEIGEEYLYSLKQWHVETIMKLVDNIFESYSTFLPKEDNGKYYKDKTTNVQYNSEGIIEEFKVSWGHYDVYEIKIDSLGLKFQFKPEHGNAKTITDIHWDVIQILSEIKE